MSTHGHTEALEIQPSNTSSFSSFFYLSILTLPSLDHSDFFFDIYSRYSSTFVRLHLSSEQVFPHFRFLHTHLQKITSLSLILTLLTALSSYLALNRGAFHVPWQYRKD